MKRLIAYCAVVALTLPLLAGPSLGATGKTSPPAQKEAQGDAAGANAVIDAVNKAIAAGDAAAFAALWAKDGSYTDADGNIYSGQDSLQKRFADVFSTVKPQVALKPRSMKLLSPTVAVSEGSVLGKDNAGKEAADTRYNMVLAKPAGKWLIVNASETAIVSEQAGTTPGLNDLEWMIGDWKAEKDGTTLKLHVDWAGNKNFIRWNYQIGKTGDKPQESTEVIAFDPRTQQTVSWSFDSNGSFGESVWHKDGQSWQMESLKTAPDGTYLTAVNLIKPNSRGFTWQSTNRTSGDMPLNDTNELQIERVSRVTMNQRD